MPLLGCCHTDMRYLQSSGWFQMFPSVTTDRSYTASNSAMDKLSTDFVFADFTFELACPDSDCRPYIQIHPADSVDDPNRITIKIPINNTPEQVVPLSSVKSRSTLTFAYMVLNNSFQTTYYPMIWHVDPRSGYEH